MVVIICEVVHHIIDQAALNYQPASSFTPIFDLLFGAVCQHLDKIIDFLPWGFLVVMNLIELILMDLVFCTHVTICISLEVTAACHGTTEDETCLDFILIDSHWFSV